MSRILTSVKPSPSSGSPTGRIESDVSRSKEGVETILTVVFPGDSNDTVSFNVRKEYSGALFSLLESNNIDSYTININGSASSLPLYLDESEEVELSIVRTTLSEDSFISLKGSY